MQATACLLLAEAADHLALQGGDAAYSQAGVALRQFWDLAPVEFASWYLLYRDRNRRRRNLLQALSQAEL